MDHLSSSQINLYLLCGLKYKYQYIDRLPKPFRSSALVFGGAVHSALAWFHEKRKQGTEVSLEDLYKIFDTDWYAQTVDTEIRFKTGEQAMTLNTLAKEFLGMYLEENHVNVEAYELPFRIPLVHPKTGDNLGVPFEGFMDLVEKNDTIVEFKTSAQTMQAGDVHRNLQLTAYSYAYERLHRRRPKKLKLINFVKGRKPKMVVFETKREKRDYEGFFFVVEEVLKGITSEVFIPRQGYWCKDCEYADICPVMGKQK